jgi:hypothetical protein
MKERTDLDDLTACLEIDPDALDVAWVNQPGLMAHWAAKLERCRHRLEIAKSNERLREAQMDAKVRSQPERYKIKRLSEGAINSVIAQDATLLELQQATRAAQREVSLHSAAVDAIHQRRYALQNLVQLLTMDYFAGPKMPRNLREEVRKSAQTKVKEVHNRREA